MKQKINIQLKIRLYLEEIIYVFSTTLVLVVPNQADQSSGSSIWGGGGGREKKKPVIFLVKIMLPSLQKALGIMNVK